MDFELYRYDIYILFDRVHSKKRATIAGSTISYCFIVIFLFSEIMISGPGNRRSSWITDSFLPRLIQFLRQPTDKTYETIMSPESDISTFTDYSDSQGASPLSYAPLSGRIPVKVR